MYVRTFFSMQNTFGLLLLKSEVCSKPLKPKILATAKNQAWCQAFRRKYIMNCCCSLLFLIDWSIVGKQFALEQRNFLQDYSLAKVFCIRMRTRGQTVESYNELGWRKPQRSFCSNPTAVSRAATHSTRVPRAPSSLALNLWRWSILNFFCIQRDCFRTNGESVGQCFSTELDFILKLVESVRCHAVPGASLEELLCIRVSRIESESVHFLQVGVVR